MWLFELVKTESIEYFIEDQAFLRSYDSAPRQPPFLPPLSHQQVVSLSLSFCVSPAELTDGRRGEGVGEEPNHTTAKKPVRL
jgi:hypothetical protein